MELNVQEPTPTESQEPSTAPSQPSPSFNNPAFNPDVEIHKSTVKMLRGFREGVREGTYKGANLTNIAMGLQFLDGMVEQSESQLQYAIRLKKESEAQAKEQIKKNLAAANAAPLAVAPDAAPAPEQPNAGS